MPWNSKSYPAAFKSLDEKVRNKAIRQAESIRLQAVEDGASEDEAIRLAIAAALRNTDTKNETIEYEDVKLARLTSLKEIQQNFEAGLLGTDVAIDISHNPSSGAAAWIKSLSVKPSTSKVGKQALFATLDWTDFGKKQVPRYNYISAEYGPTIDPETHKKTKNVLKAATLTNRPFVKGMRPVSENLEEIEILREGDYTHPLFGELNITNEDVELFTQEEVQGETMDKLTKFLQDAGVTLEEGLEIQDAVLQFIEDQSVVTASLTEQVEALTTQLEEKATPNSDNVELEELSNKIVKLTEDFAAAEEKNVALEQKLFEKDRDVFLSNMVSQGRMLPAEMESYKKLYAADQETTIAVLEAREPVVNLSELGGNDDTALSSEDKLHNAAIKLQEGNAGLSYRDAIIQASATVGDEE